MLDPAIEFALRGAISLLLATAAFHKLRDPIAFWQVVAAYRLVPEFFARAVAFVIPTIEIALAVSLLVFVGTGLPVIAVIFLWLVYGAAIAINLLRGRLQLECGCGGLAADQTIHWGLVGRNGLLVATTGLLLLPSNARALFWLDFSTAFFGALVLILLYAAMDHLLRNSALLLKDSA